jgi:hypothetical protein
MPPHWRKCARLLQWLCGDGDDVAAVGSTDPTHAASIISTVWTLGVATMILPGAALNVRAHSASRLSLASARPWLAFDSVAGMVPGGASGATVLSRIFLLPPRFREPPATIAVGMDIRESL